MQHIHVSDVRDYIADRGSDDNPYLCDLAYTDEEIEKAMKTCAREYNSIPPLGVDCAHWYCLPLDTNIFLDGCAAALLRTEKLRRGRNDVEYSMAGASAATEAVRLAHIEAEEKQMHARFKEAAMNYRLTINIYNYFGPIV